MVVWKVAILRSFGGKLDSNGLCFFGEFYWYLIVSKYITT